jgi:hypothetical protein
MLGTDGTAGSTSRMHRSTRSMPTPTTVHGGLPPRQADHRLPDEELALIAGDQITDDAILRCSVPDHARPILLALALDDQYEPVLEVPGRAPTEAVDDRAPQNDDLAVALDGCCAGAAQASQPMTRQRRSARASRRSAPRKSLS